MGRWIITKKPGEDCVIKRFDEARIDLEYAQSIVGGPIQLIPFGTAIHMYVNEEGNITGMEPNIVLPEATIVGPLLLCTHHNGRMVGFPDYLTVIKMAETLNSKSYQPPLEEEIE